MPSTQSSFTQIQNDSFSQPTLATSEELVVAIFFWSYIHVRDALPDTEGRLGEYYARLKQGRDPYGRDKFAMGTLREEEEAVDEMASALSTDSKVCQGSLALHILPTATYLHLPLSSHPNATSE